MTYCLAAIVDDGLVFVSDSRTNAGIDQLGSYSKMHSFADLPDRFFVLLSAGNLATTQAVVARISHDIEEGAATSLASIDNMREAGDYVGEVSRETQDRFKDQEESAGFSPSADFILGGQIGDAPPALFHIYSAGNYVAPTELAPFVQIGEQKYGKPILDRIVTVDTPLETVALCGLVSMDSTMRSNAGVGPPIELMMYRPGPGRSHTHIVYSEDDPFLREIRETWAENLRKAFDQLPAITLPDPRVRLVDG